MTRKGKMVFWLITVLCTGAAFAQVSIPEIRVATGPQANKSPVAYVYVNVMEGGNAEIYGFTADSSGGLTGIPGSPFTGFANIGYWAGKNGYLFATDGTTDATYIDSYSVSSIGVPRRSPRSRLQARTSGYAACSSIALQRTCTTTSRTL